MGLFEKIRNFTERAGQPGTGTAAAIEEVDRALTLIRDKRAEIERRIDEARAERASLLTMDDSSARRRELRDLVDDLEETGTGLDRAEADLTARRAGLMTVKRRERVRDEFSRFSTVAAEYDQIARAAYSKGRELVAIRGELIGAGFATEVTNFFPAPAAIGMEDSPSFVIAADTLDRFEIAVAQARIALDPAPRPSKTRPAPVVAPPPKPKAADTAPRAPRPSRAPVKIDGPVPDGMVAIRYLRNGTEKADGTQSIIGDEGVVSPEHGRILMMNAAADLIEPPPGPELPDTAAVEVAS